jgi:2-polyprenyl-3-methyl-5-hydroxy-6-metoxy-1,4-benzoquinol methylase
LGKRLFRLLRRARYRVYARHLDRSLKTILDLGAGDGSFVRLAGRMGYEAVGTDLENDVAGNTRCADIVTCFQTLEHVPDPPAALRNLAALPWKQLMISVPNEPWFSIWRGSWEKEHRWAIDQSALRLYLGEPAFETTMVLRRYYFAIWRKVGGEAR